MTQTLQIIGHSWHSDVTGDLEDNKASNDQTWQSPQEWLQEDLGHQLMTDAEITKVLGGGCE